MCIMLKIKLFTKRVPFLTGAQTALSCGSLTNPVLNSSFVTLEKRYSIKTTFKLLYSHLIPSAQKCENCSQQISTLLMKYRFHEGPRVPLETPLLQRYQVKGMLKKNWGQCLRIFNNDQYYTCGNTKSDIKHTNVFFIRNKNANAPLSVIKCD